MCCLDYKHVAVEECPDIIEIGDLVGFTEYTYEFTNKFGKKYSGTAVATASNVLRIPVDGNVLRKDMFQRFSGEYELRLYADNEQVKFCNLYDHLIIYFTKSTGGSVPKRITCSSISNPGDGDPNEYPWGLYKAEAGIPGDTTGMVSYSVHFSNARTDDINETYITTWNEFNMLVDFGDGVPRKYPDRKHVGKLFNAGESVTITVWHDHSPVKVGVGSDSGRGAINAGYTGVLPNQLLQFSASDRLENLPALPATCKFIDLFTVNLTSEKIDAELQRCVDDGQTGGSFTSANAATPNNISAIDTLRNQRGWYVQMAGMNIGGSTPGVEVDPSEYAGLDYVEFTMTGAQLSTLKLGSTKGLYVNWGDQTTVRKYVGNTTGNLFKHFYSIADVTVRIYCHNNEETLIIRCAKQTITGWSGTFPPALLMLDLARDYAPKFEFVSAGLLGSSSIPGGGFTVTKSKATTQGLTELPVSLLPPTISWIDVRHNSLTTQGMDDIIVFCNGLNQPVNLLMSLQTDFVRPAALVALRELADGGSTIIINDGYSGSNTGAGFNLLRTESFEHANILNVTPTQPIGSTPSFKVNLSNVGNSSISIGSQNLFIVKWNANLYIEYPAATMVRHTYTNESDVEIEVYTFPSFVGADKLGRIYIAGELGETAKIESIEQLEDANYINIENINAEVADIQPVLVDKNWIRIESNLSVSEVNALIDIADAVNGNVMLMIRQNPPAVPTNPALNNIFQTMHD